MMVHSAIKLRVLACTRRAVGKTKYDGTQRDRSSGGKTRENVTRSKPLSLFHSAAIMSPFTISRVEFSAIPLYIA